MRKINKTRGGSSISNAKAVLGERLIKNSPVTCKTGEKELKDAEVLATNTSIDSGLNYAKIFAESLESSVEFGDINQGRQQSRQIY
jgi:hypothetical protein